jgi:NAD(P)-dependent dehydrogenase (short-subunit alcohol dehydrogenase family)
MGRLDGKVALITGAGSGLGLAVARRFLLEGARVGVLEIAKERADRIADELAGSGLVSVTVGDVTSMADNLRAVAATEAAFGRLDVFVGNAGIYDGRIPLEHFPADRLSDAFDELFSINVKGYALGARAAIPALRRAGGGSIVFTGSVSSHYAGFGGALYIAAKHAIAGLTRQLALELAPSIRVNAVAPGFAPTSLTGLSDPGVAARVAKPGADALPLARIAGADDYAGLYVLLAGDESASTMTGSVLEADGGISLWGPGRPVPPA